VKSEFYENKNIAITGAAGGLGKELVSQLYKLNANIYSIVSQRSNVADIKSFSKEIHRCDLGCKNDLEDLLNKDFFNEVDILINCAGLWYLKDIDTISLDEYDKVMNVNVRSPFALSLRCAKSMGEGGLIINIGSSSSYNGCKEAGAYAISKHALLGMSKSLSQAFIKKGIRVLMVSPASLKTKMGKLDERQDFNSFLDPAEVAKFIIFTSSFRGEMIVEESRLNRKCML
jgi:NAD(P)-dependent dehydrogenase (short-subunit alcohol dehydrogenase family)